MAISYTVGKHYEEFIKKLVDSGRYATPSDVMREGLRLIEVSEDQREAKLHALRSALQEGVDSGPAEDVDPSELAKRVKERGRERLRAVDRDG